MEELRRTSVLLLIVAILHQSPSSTALDAHKVLHIPEKIIGGVIDIVQSHKNKPSQQASFQQSVQTQTTFSQQGNPQGTPPANVQPWTGPAYQGAGFQGQAQIQAQGQYGNFGNQASGGNYQTAPVAPLYPVNTSPALTGPPGPYPPISGSYQQQLGFAQSQNQGQYQNNQNQGQYQNQNQGNFQGQGQNQNQGNYQTGQYGSSGFQGTGQYLQPSGGNTGNYQGQNVGQASGGNYQGQNSGQSNSGNYQGQNGQTSGNYQNTQTGQFQGNHNGQFNNNQQGGQNHNGQINQNQQGGQFSQSGQNQSGYYQGSQQTSSQTGQSSSGSQSGSFGGSQSGSFGGSQSGGFQTSSSHQSGSPAPTCICQAWTKPPEPQILNDEPPKPQKIEKKTDEIKPAA